MANGGNWFDALPVEATPSPVASPAATPSASDLVARAKSFGDAYVPSPTEAQQMAGDLAQIAARKGATDAQPAAGDENAWYGTLPLSQDQTTPDAPAPASAPEDEPLAREAAIAGSGLAKGATGLFNMEGPVDNLLGSYVLDPLNKALFGPSTQTTAQTNQQYDATLSPQALARKAGIVDNPALAPKDTAERFLAGGSQAIGGSLPFLPVAGPSALGWAFTGGGTGNVLGDYMRGLFPEHPELAGDAGELAGSLVAPATAWGATKALGPLAEWVARSWSPSALTEQAAQRVADAMNEDIDAYHAATGTGMTPQKFQSAVTEGQAPFVPEDAENTRALAGSLMRSGGPAKNIVKADLRGQDALATQRVEAPFADVLGTGDILAEAKSIADQQKSAAAPLYQQAFSGGSTAPLEVQLRNALQTATGAKGTIAKEIAKIERENPGALAARGAAGADTRARYMDLHQQLAQAEADRQATLDMFQKAKADATANAPGAVWSPRIQQFLDDPIFRQGLGRGLAIQRLESLAEGRPFNPTEYAITGADEAGNPIVGNVPNMRLLDAGKRGLDQIIQEDRNKSAFGKLSEYGRAVNEVRKAYLAELDTANPTYAQARGAWSGPAGSLDAIRNGASALTKTPAEIKADLAALSPNDQRLYRLSAMQQAVAPKIEGGSLGANEAIRVLANTPQKLKPQLAALFPDQASADAALKAAQRANLEFQAKQKIMGGSDTAERVAADRRTGAHGDGHAFGALAGLEMLHGEPTTAAGLWALRYLRDAIGHRISVSPKLNAEMARLITARDPQTLAPVLAKLGLHRRPFFASPFVASPFGALAPQATGTPANADAR